MTLAYATAAETPVLAALLVFAMFALWMGSEPRRNR